MLVLFFLMTSLLSRSQILNFEKFRLNKDTSNVWALSTAAGIDLKKKTSESTKFNSRVSTYYLSERNAYYFLGNFSLTRVNNINIFEQGYVHFRMVFNRRHKLAYEPFLQLQYDLGKGLKRRHLYGGNFRMNLYEDSTITFSVGSGIFYENENWLNEDDLSIQNNNLKSNNYISTQCKINDWMNFLLTGYYQASFDDFTSPRLIVDSNLRMKFTDTFAYDVHFELSADRKPVVETGRLIYLLSSGFRVSF